MTKQKDSKMVLRKYLEDSGELIGFLESLGQKHKSGQEWMGKIGLLLGMDT